MVLVFAKFTGDMLSDQSLQLQHTLEECRNEDRGTDFWYARDLQKSLGYTRWENFEKVVLKAIDNCKTVDADAATHFVEVDRVAGLGKGAKREITDWAISRYGAYLVAVNADSAKPDVAYIKNYFIVQARKQELIEQRILDVERIETRNQLKASEKALSGAFQEGGLDGPKMAIVRSKGDRELFGGLSTQDMKARYGITSKKPLADVLPTLTLSAKTMVNEMTRLNLEEKSIQGERSITREHVQNNRSMRGMLIDRGFKPEELPAAEDSAKVERRLRSEEKALLKAKLPKQIDTGRN